MSLVAKYENKIIGNILLYPIKIINAKREDVSLALAPISVLPKFQGNEIGSNLIREALEKTQKLGFKSVIVVGNSEYYPKFGFKKASKYGISAPFEVSEVSIFALELEKNIMKKCRGTVDYPQNSLKVNRNKRVSTCSNY